MLTSFLKPATQVRLENTGVVSNHLNPLLLCFFGYVAVFRGGLRSSMAVLRVVLAAKERKDRREGEAG
jgi:hypothetical protein